MVSAATNDAVANPKAAIRSLFHKQHCDLNGFPAAVSSHFAHIFRSDNDFNQIPALDPSTQIGTLVSFKAMVQDTSASPEMYLAKSGSDCGGWDCGIDHTESPVDYANLRECTSIWAVNIPNESKWCFETSPASNLSSSPALSHKFPIPEVSHLGVQVKIYESGQRFKPTELVNFIGIFSLEPLLAQSEDENPPNVPTLHVVFSRRLPPTLVEFPPLLLSAEVETRDSLISWIAEEGLGGDLLAAEWILLTIIARVHSRTPDILPPSLTLTHFPPAPPGARSVPTLNFILQQILPTFLMIPLSLFTLNSTYFYPQSKNEDLHSGWMQLPAGSTMLITEQGISQGTVDDRGLDNIQAVQGVIKSQTLDYVFPFSKFTFFTDITVLALTEGSKSTFFQTSANLPLERRQSSTDGVYYKPQDQIAMPSQEILTNFRNLVGAAKACDQRLEINDVTSKHIQDDFVLQRQSNKAGSDDLIHLMAIARLLALSKGQKAVTAGVWDEAKELDRKRKHRILSR